MTKREIMVKAWTIAKEGAARFGGKVSEYLSEALKTVWANFKRDKALAAAAATKKKNAVIMVVNNFKNSMESEVFFVLKGDLWKWHKSNHRKSGWYSTFIMDRIRYQLSSEFSYEVHRDKFIKQTMNSGIVEEIIYIESDKSAAVY